MFALPRASASAARPCRRTQALSVHDPPEGPHGRRKAGRTGHALDAVCVGEVETLAGWQIPTLEIKATGRGTCCRTKLTAHGFPRGYCTRQKSVKAYHTGDMVLAECRRARTPESTSAASLYAPPLSFSVGKADGINAKHCKLLHRGDGYGWRPALPPAAEVAGFQRGGFL